MDDTKTRAPEATEHPHVGFGQPVSGEQCGSEYAGVGNRSQGSPKIDKICKQDVIDEAIQFLEKPNKTPKTITPEAGNVLSTINGGGSAPSDVLQAFFSMEPRVL